MSADVSKISLSSIPANLIDCLDIGIEPVWDYLTREQQIHELEQARETLNWRRGPGKSWCEFVENTLMTEIAALRHYQRQLLGKTLSAREMIDYLVAECGLTHPQAGKLTMPQEIEILRAACQRKGIAGHDGQTLWSTPTTMNAWASVFRVGRATIRRWLSTDQIKNQKVGGLYQIAIADLPADERAKYRPPEQPR